MSEVRAVYMTAHHVTPPARIRMDTGAIRGVERMTVGLHVLTCQLGLFCEQLRREHHMTGPAARILAHALDWTADLTRLEQEGRRLLDGAREREY